jgi:hypothetical protein
MTGGPVGVGGRYRMAFTQGPAVISECVRFERPGLWEHADGTTGHLAGFPGQPQTGHVCTGSPVSAHLR